MKYPLTLMPCWRGRRVTDSVIRGVMRWSITVRILGAPDSMPRATSCGPLARNAAGTWSSSRSRTLMRPVASHTYRSPIRASANALRAGWMTR
jgi:hypothetical protein